MSRLGILSPDELFFNSGGGIKTNTEEIFAKYSLDPLLRPKLNCLFISIKYEVTSYN